MADRDRDRADDGSPRNQRPRDALGRPLPYGSIGVPTTPDDLSLSPTATLQRADALLHAGRPFHAHEVLELQWKSCPPQQRALWQALAQVAVALTHVARGNPSGAVSVLRRADRVLTAYQGDVPAGLNLDALRSWCQETLAGGVGSDASLAQASPLPNLWTTPSN